MIFPLGVGILVWSSAKAHVRGHCITTAIALVVPPFSKALSDNFG